MSNQILFLVKLLCNWMQRRPELLPVAPWN